MNEDYIEELRPINIQSRVRPEMHWRSGDNTLLLLGRAAKLCDKAHLTLAASEIRREINSGDMFEPGKIYLSFPQAMSLVSKHIEVFAKETA